MLAINPGFKTQENISLIKMEYFLYGLTEAYTIVKEI